MQNMDAVADALREVLELVEGADAREMVGRRPKPAAPEMPGSEEHESEEAALLRELENMHPEDKEEGY